MRSSHLWQSHFWGYSEQLRIQGNAPSFNLVYDYHECGICKIYKGERCFKLAKYLCRLDFIMADMMGVKLVRTKTIADGGDRCGFRYGLK